ncbi:Membrane protein insertase YidC [termite gut metagenome]|uniref:Membrane protein insertase YidC n=1 Tax=termite gut metagenome TaxID=433724 RepID=A0A5J4SV44_9ZZZZ
MSMDKNTVIGLVLIGILLIGFSFLSHPSQEQIEASRHHNDSTILQQKEEILKAKAAAALSNEKEEAKRDSNSLFFYALQGNEEFTTIENTVIKLTFTNKGGQIYSALLKNYKGQDKESLILFDNREVFMNFYFYNLKEIIQTKDYYFEMVDKTDTCVTMRLTADNESYIDFIYQLRKNNYMVDFIIRAVGMENKLALSTNYVDIEWKQRARQQEKGYMYENRLSDLTYKLVGDGTDNLSQSRNEEKTLNEQLDWIAYKSQFFSSVFISEHNFGKNHLFSRMEDQGSGYIKSYAVEMNTFFDPRGAEPTTMHLYFGPNHYKTLMAFDKGRDEKWELADLVYLGWPIVRWINKWFTINIFDWLSGMGFSMGIVLLLMTVIVKIVVFPATWKTYISSAKMRVLKPQVDIINEKYPKKEDAMKKQQETMTLYSQYGVSPMGGCLPMLLQFPILMALFMFVPSAIELRQESFLWANDLSTYDALITFPFHIPFMGNHLSLFCLLMTITNILNTKYSMAQQTSGQQQIPGMKWMMYLMPVMFLFVLNDYPSGLNYYYFISTLISIVTMIILRKATNEEKLLAQLEINKAKPKKTTRFAARLAAMQQQQQLTQQNQSNKK